MQLNLAQNNCFTMCELLATDALRGQHSVRRSIRYVTSTDSELTVEGPSPDVLGGFGWAPKSHLMTTYIILQPEVVYCGLTFDEL